MSRDVRSPPRGIKLLFRQLRRLQALAVSAELDDFAQEVGGLAFPVGHGFDGVGMAGGELDQRFKLISAVCFVVWGGISMKR